jgi:Lon protease-like protein
MKPVIPIFPLKLVVFPLSKYPLHIFEKRYKLMINKCMEEDTGFGITASISGEFSHVGTYVVITKVMKKYLTGEMDIIIQGKERFNMTHFEMHPDGYYTANVEEYDDYSSSVDNELLTEVKTKFEKIIDRVDYKLEESFWKNFHKSRLKSYKMAEKSGLSIKQQQTLLSLRDESERINFLIEHFEKLDENLSENSELKNIILGDGYIN